MTLRKNIKLWVRRNEKQLGFTMTVREVSAIPQSQMDHSVMCFINFRRGWEPSPYNITMHANGNFSDASGPLIVKRYKRDEYLKHAATAVGNI